MAQNGEIPLNLKQLETEVEKIKQRNQRVELDKKWETSAERKILISILTYLVILIFMLVSKIPDPFTNAVVPTAGFVLSTLSLPFFKEMWIKRFYKKYSKKQK